MSTSTKAKPERIIAESILEMIVNKTNGAPGTDSICAACSKSYRCEAMCDDFKTRFIDDISNLLIQNSKKS